MRSHSVHSQTLLKLEERVLKKTVPQLPLLPEYGRGSWLYDESGNRYLDFFTGHGVMCLGHAHPALTEAMIGQIHKLVHTGNHFHLEPRIRLAVRLSELADGGQVFFSNSGAEIVELAIKLCRRRKRGNPRPTIVCMRGSFHGRTYGALSATRQREYKRRLGPFLPGFVEVPFNDPEALNRAMTHHTAGVLIEPVLGEGGVIPATRDYLALARELCTRTGALLVFDEIQTGLGRTGEMFACRRYRVRPDVLLLGKALGGGLPLSALITHPEAASLLGLGDHGSTFGGNPVAAAAGNALLAVLTAPGFLPEVKKKSHLLIRTLQRLKNKHPRLVREVRGLGLLVGIELSGNAQQAVAHALAHGLLINNPTGQVIRILPPYTVTDEEIELFAEKFDAALARCEKGA